MMDFQMISVEIKSDAVESRNGKNGIYYKQTGYVPMMNIDGVADFYPSKIQFMVFKDDKGNPQPYPVGNYVVHPSSFRINKYGDLEIGFLRLHPVKNATDKPAVGRASK